MPLQERLGAGVRPAGRVGLAVAARAPTARPPTAGPPRLGIAGRAGAQLARSGRAGRARRVRWAPPPRPAGRRAGRAAAPACRWSSSPAHTRSQIAATTASSPGRRLPGVDQRRARRVGELAEEQRPAGRPARRSRSGQPSAASSARCSGVATMSGSGSGSSRSATSAGATASQPSMPASGAAAGPGDLARRGQLVEQRRGVAGQPGGQDQRLQRARRQRRPGQLLDHPQHVLGARRPPHPARAGRRRRRSARPARPAGTGPAPAARPAPPRPAAGPARPAAAGAAPRRRSTRCSDPCRPRARRAQLAADQPPDPDQPVEHPGDDGHAEPEPARRTRAAAERAVGAGVAEQQIAQRIGHRLGERLRHPDRQRGAERVAHPAGVLDRQPALLAADPHPDRAAAPPPARRATPARTPRARRLGRGQVAEEPQQVGRPLGVAGVPVRREPLQRRLDLGEHLRDRAAPGSPPSPSSSASSVESSDSAAARRSASGASVS